MSEAKSYDESVPDAAEFRNIREEWRTQLEADEELRAKAIQLIVESNKYNYGHQWEWCGVPVIRHPDDIVLQQEIMWELKPARIIETGVARGGSLVLSASLMRMNAISPKVLGLDIQILPHAFELLEKWLIRGDIELLECDSASEIAKARVGEFIGGIDEPCLLILDSNHSHGHVLRELNVLAPLLPVGSLVIVTDTIVEEMPADYYPNRPWGRGNSPYTASREFLEHHSEYGLDTTWSRRALLGECRDGVLKRLG